MKQLCLEITRLTKSGDTVKKFTCRSGRVSVFRSKNEELHRLYTNALSGGEHDGRFTITLNGETFDPQDHILIGYNSNIQMTSDLTVTQFLKVQGIQDNEIERVITTYGLAGTADVPVEKLNDVQKHALMLLYATTQTERIVIVRDPLEPLSEEHREAFAKRIVDYVWEKQMIVIVTNLSWRPESWIDNDLIARLQVDQTVRRATIGFGGDNILSDMAKKIRQGFSKDTSPAAAAPQPVRVASTKIIVEEQPKEDDKKEIENLRRQYSTKNLFLLGTSVTCALVAVVALALLPDDRRVATVAVQQQGTPSTGTSSTQEQGSATNGKTPSRVASASQGTNMKGAQSSTTESNGEVQYAMVLESYPYDIQQSIKNAYQGKIDLDSVTGLENKARTRAPSYSNAARSTQQQTRSSQSWHNKPRGNYDNNQRQEVIANKSKIFEKLLELRARGNR